jgi:hypothetical protein
VNLLHPQFRTDLWPDKADNLLSLSSFTMRPIETLFNPACVQRRVMGQAIGGPDGE